MNWRDDIDEMLKDNYSKSIISGESLDSDQNAKAEEKEPMNPRVVMNYGQYRRVLSSCGKSFYNKYKDMIGCWTGDNSVLAKEIFRLEPTLDRNTLRNRISNVRRILNSPFAGFSMLKPQDFNVFYESGVPDVERDGHLVKLVETLLEQVDSMKDHLDYAYSLNSWFMGSCENDLPNICLSNKIIECEGEYRLRDTNEIDSNIAEQEQDCHRGDFIRDQIVLSSFIPEQNIIVLYYKAIVKFVESNCFRLIKDVDLNKNAGQDDSVAYYNVLEDVWRGIIAKELFRACHYYESAYDNANDIWTYYGDLTKTGKKCQDIIEGASEFFSYAILKTYYGHSNYADYMHYCWRRNFLSTDSKAQALYFFYSGSVKFPDLSGSLMKLDDVYFCDDIDEALRIIRMAYMHVPPMIGSRGTASKSPAKSTAPKISLLTDRNGEEFEPNYPDDYCDWSIEQQRAFDTILYGKIRGELMDKDAHLSLTILEILQHTKNDVNAYTVHEIADLIEMDKGVDQVERTIRRHIERLKECGYIAESRYKKNGYYYVGLSNHSGRNGSKLILPLAILDILKSNMTDYPWKSALSAKDIASRVKEEYGGNSDYKTVRKVLTWLESGDFICKLCGKQGGYYYDRNLCYRL